MSDTIFITRQDLIRMDKERKLHYDGVEDGLQHHSGQVDNTVASFPTLEPEVSHANFREMIKKYVIAKERPRQKQPERIDDCV